MCDVGESILGEDAFYRDAFHDCSEGNTEHDGLFLAAREQAWLKMTKGSAFAEYASFEIQQRARAYTRSVTSEFQQCLADPRPVEDEQLPAMSPRRMSVTSATIVQEWLGKTMQEWKESDFPPLGEGPYWANSEGEGLKVRCGPNYKKFGKKTEAGKPMYSVLTCDAIKGENRIEDVIGRLVPHLPAAPASFVESDRGAGPPLSWVPECGLPRVICINLMLPYETGLVPFRHDPGCSFVAFFHIKPETLHAAVSDQPPPAIRLLKEFCAGPAGYPGGPVTNPDRCLHSRLDTSKKKDMQSGIFKCTAQCLNPRDVNVPDFLHSYNGKPALITKSGYIIKDPSGEWLEIGIDVRGFNILARKMLCSLRGLLPQTRIHYGFMVQGFEDEDLPEGLICDMHVYGTNIIDDPAFIHLPSSSSS